jgi:hypothetical protein
MSLLPSGECAAPEAHAAVAAVLLRRAVEAKQRSAELVAASRGLRHASRVLLAWEQTQRARHRGLPVAPPAWFALVGMVDGRVVRAVFDNGRLRCDPLLERRGGLLVELGEEFTCDQPPRRFQASLQAPPVAVALTLVRACDVVLRLEVDVGQSAGR